MRVLLIEDEATTARWLELMLTREGFNVYSTDLGEEGLDLAKHHDYDIVLLDLDLPDLHGHEVLKGLRAAKVATPVMILTGNASIEARVRGFELGADEHLAKPFYREELIARILAVVRRSNGHSQSVIRTGKLALDLSNRTAEVGGAQIHLTGKEYATLELLSLRKGSTLTSDMFLNHVYDGIKEPEPQIFDVYVYKLRKKLSAACGGEDYIHTVRGHGYVMNDPKPRARAA